MTQTAMTSATPSTTPTEGEDPTSKTPCCQASIILTASFTLALPVWGIAVIAVGGAIILAVILAVVVIILFCVCCGKAARAKKREE